MDLIIFKGNRFYQKGIFDIKILQKEQNLYADIPQKSNHELKRHVKYNSEKLFFLKLRIKFFDKLRNRGFRIYYLTKVFASVSYSSRNKYLFTSDKIYSNVVQEMQAEAAIMEVGEAIFQHHLNS